MIKHVVLMKAKAGVSEEQIAKAFEGLKALVGVIPGIVDFTGGPDLSTESRARGYTHGFVMTLVDAAARDAYLPHPAHQAAAGPFRACAEETLIIDL